MKAKGAQLNVQTHHELQLMQKESFNNTFQYSDVDNIIKCFLLYS